jgi:UDP-N-acetylglucosamine transferase subunit ALG13
MEHLYESYDIDVITSDRAYDYLKQSPVVRSVYRQADLNIAKPLRYGSLNYYVQYIPHFLKRIWTNYKIQNQIIELNRYERILTDSDYSLIFHRIFNRNKLLFLISINNAFEVLQISLKSRDFFKPQFLGSSLVELLDFIFHFSLSHRIVCPCLSSNHSVPKLFSKKVTKIPALVRRSVVDDHSALENGSVLVSHTSSKVHTALKAIRIEGAMPGDFSLKNQKTLREASYVVCNAGQSTIAECLYLGKKSVVLPIERHLEQHINAQVASAFGMMVLQGVQTNERIQSSLQILKQAKASVRKRSYFENLEVVKQKLRQDFEL